MGSSKQSSEFLLFFTVKEILLKLFYSLRSPLFSIQWPLPEKRIIVLIISVRRWSKIFFMKVKNKKHFLPESDSINLSQHWIQYVDRVSHDRDFSQFFHFHLPWKWPKYAKISNNRAEKSEKSRSPKTRKMSPKPLPNGFKLSVWVKNSIPKLISFCHFQMQSVTW